MAFYMLRPHCAYGCGRRKPALGISCCYNYVGFSVCKLCENVKNVNDSFGKLIKSVRRNYEAVTYI